MYKQLINNQLNIYKSSFPWIDKVQYSDFIDEELTQFKGNLLTAGLASQIEFVPEELGQIIMNFDVQYVLVYDQKFDEENVLKSMISRMGAGVQLKAYNPSTASVYELIFEEPLKSDDFKMALFILNHSEIVDSYKNCDIEPC